MTMLYVDVPVTLPEPNLNVIKMAWNRSGNCLALATYNIERGGSIALLNERGEFYDSIIYPVIVTAEVNQLVWHPIFDILISAWTNGDLFVWCKNDFEKFSLVRSPHQKHITGLIFNSKGAQFITYDQGGLVILWSINLNGTICSDFQKNFKQVLIRVCFNSTSCLIENETESEGRLNKNNDSIYVITKSGTIYFVDYAKNCSKLITIKCKNCIDYAILNSEQSTLLIFKDCCVLDKYQIEWNGKLKEISNVEFQNNKSPSPLLNHHRFLLVDKNTLVILIDDFKVLNLNLKTNETTLIPITSAKKKNDYITSLSYCENKRILNATSKSGEIYFWNFTKTKWISLNTLTLLNTCNNVREAIWHSARNNPSLNLLAVNCSTKLFFIKESETVICYLGSIWAVQTHQTLVTIKMLNFDYELNTGISVIKMDMNLEYLVVSNSQEIVIFKVKLGGSASSKLKVREFNRYYYKNDGIFLVKKILIVISKNELCIKNIIENMERKLLLKSQIVAKNVSSHYVVIYLESDFFNVYEINSDFNNLKLIHDTYFGAKRPYHTIKNIKYFPKIVAFTAEDIPKIFLWNFENEKLLHVEFNREKLAHSDYYFQTDSFFDTDDRIVVVDFFWDQSAKIPYLLCCIQQNQRRLCSSFLIEQNTIYPVSVTEISIYCKPLTYEAPNLIVYENHVVSKIILHEFRQFQTPNINYVYNVCTSRLSSALDCIKFSNDPLIWLYFAKNCILHENLNLCLNVLSYKKDLFAIQIAESSIDKKDRDPLSKLADLALYFGMDEKAEVLMKKALNQKNLAKFYCEIGQFQKSIDFAEENNIVMLRNCYYKWGNHLESLGEYDLAFDKLASSGTLESFLSKILLESPEKFDEFILRKSNDLNLMKWLAKFWESRENFDEAMRIFRLIGDYSSQLRILCHLNQEDEIISFLNSFEDISCLTYECYLYLGKFYEKINQYDKSLEFYVKAKAYYSIKRLCKERKSILDLKFVLDILPNNIEKLDCAKLFEEHSFFDNAIKLYQELGFEKKIFDLALKVSKPELIQSLIDKFNENSHDATVQKYIAHFEQINDVDSAAKVLLNIKQFDRVIELHAKHNMKSTETLIEKKLEQMDDSKERSKLLEKFAKISKNQGNYNLASKRYIKSGNRYKAMKTLLKSGEHDQIIMFARISNQADIYKLVACWLQKQENFNSKYSEVITEFYAEANAFDLLASFYEFLSQQEIIVNHDYKRSLKLLQLSLNSLQKLDNFVGSDHDGEKYFLGNCTSIYEAKKLISEKIQSVSAFLKIKNSFENSNLENGLLYCKGLVRNFDAESNIVSLQDFLDVLKQYYDFIKNDDEILEFVRNCRLKS